MTMPRLPFIGRLVGTEQLRAKPNSLAQCETTRWFAFMVFTNMGELVTREAKAR